MKLTCLYRISDGSYKKDRLPNASKKQCLNNFIGHFDNDWGADANIIIFADNVSDETLEWVSEYGYEVIRTNSEGNAYAFNMVLDYALEYLEDYVYFVEDDYLHDCMRLGIKSPVHTILMEGLLRSDYVSLYDHPDKYIPARQGGNPFIGEDRAEVTKVFRTETWHWKLTNSTTMTFATHMDVLREDRDIWKKHTDGSHPNDMQAFLELRSKGRSLATPIPSLSTHCDLPWLAPFGGWKNI